MRPNRVHLDPARDVLLVVFAAAALIWAAAVGPGAPAAAPPKINGAYKLTFAGPGNRTGTGKAVVTPKKVKIDGTLTDAQGNALTFSAPDLDVDASTYRFRGTGTLGGVAATISGRLDPDDRTVKSCRLVATFLATDGKAGRVAGSHD